MRSRYVRTLSLGEVWLLNCCRGEGRGAWKALLLRDALRTSLTMRGADLVHFILVRLYRVWIIGACWSWSYLHEKLPTVLGLLGLVLVGMRIEIE